MRKGKEKEKEKERRRSQPHRTTQTTKSTIESPASFTARGGKAGYTS
jgi:hypothetical protein